MHKSVSWALCLLLVAILLVTPGPALMQSGKEAVPAESVVVGTVVHDINGIYPGAGRCELKRGTEFYAVARLDDGGGIYAYAPTCDAPIWITFWKESDIEWDRDYTEALPVLMLPETTETAETPEPPNYFDYTDRCFVDLVWGDPPSGDYPYQIVAPVLGNASIPGLRAATEDDIDVLVCISEPRIDLGECNYTDGKEIVTLPLRRHDKVVRLLNFETGEIFAEESFQGEATVCPEFTFGASATITGDPPPSDQVVGWIAQQVLGVPAEATAARTTVNAQSINARAGANTGAEIVTQLPYGTPVLPLARNEAGDWIAGILEDGQQVWLYTSLLQVGIRANVMALPVVDDVPASDVPLWMPVFE